MAKPITIEAFDEAADALTALVARLPAGPWQEAASNHHQATIHWGHQAIVPQDEAPSPSGEPESREH